MAAASPLPLLGFLKAYPEIILSVACLLVLRLLIRLRNPMPVNWPLVGMFPAVVLHFHHFHDHITYLLRAVGCTEMFRGPWFHGMDMVLTCDPANINHVLSGNFPNYPKGDQFNEVFDIFGDGLFNADAESWKIQRKIANVYIGDRHFRTFMAAATREKAETGLLPILQQKAERGEAVELQDLFIRLSFDVTCRMVFGVDPGCLSITLPAIPFAVAINDAGEALMFRHAVPKSWWKTLKWLNVGTEKKMAKARKIIDHFIAQRIAEKEEEIRGKDKSHGDQKIASSPLMTDILASYIENVVEDIRGRDGVAVTLSWFFWLLSRNPKVEAKILEELALHRSSKENKSTAPFDSEELSKMVYLHGAVCETLRLFPPVPFEEKTALKADALPSGWKVEAGTKILLCVYAMGRMEGVWGEDCMEFKPERWISEEGRPKHVPAYKFMAFNAGPRICPGRDIALTQIKTVISVVMCNFEVEVLDSHPVAPNYSAMLGMQQGMMVKIRPRRTTP